MLEIFSKYRIQKTDKNFKLPDGQMLSQTAVISLLNNDDTVLATLELGVVGMPDLYAQILNNQPVLLDQCYIENFSLTYLREKAEIRTGQYVNIKRFAVTNSVFYSENHFDFSYVNLINGDLNLSHSIFLNCHIDFRYTKFGNEDINFDGTYIHQGSINFANATFGKGQLSFNNSRFNCLSGDRRLAGQKKTKRKEDTGAIINFESCSFEDGKIDFTRSDFGSGIISFFNSDLRKRDLLFISAEFETIRLNFRSFTFRNGKLDFRFANFNRGDMLFDRAVFKKSVIDFSAIELKHGKFSFNRTEFEKIELIFESSEIDRGKILFKNNLFDYGNINFNSARLHAADILFENLDFGKVTASFLRARLNNLLFRFCHINAYFNLQIRKCRTLNLSNTVVRDIVDIKPFGFKPDIQFLNLSGLLLLGNLYIDWKTSKVKDLILSQQSSFRAKSEQFRVLKENYRSLGQYSAEDGAYIEFRRSEAKADLEVKSTNGNWFSKVRAYVTYAFKWLVFDKIGLYATNPVRVLTSMIFVYLFFVLIYYFLPFFVEGQILPSQDHGDIAQLGTAFYHSIITFLTIGYGDYYPTGIFRWISGFEGFMGLFLISYFTVAFVRKVLR